MLEASTDLHTFTHRHTDPSTAPHTHIHSHRHGFAQFPHRGRNPHPRTPSRPHTCTQTHSHTFMQVRTHSHTGSRTDPHTCRGIHTAEGGIKKGSAGACYVRGLHGRYPCKRPKQAYCTLTHTHTKLMVCKCCKIAPKIAAHYLHIFFRLVCDCLKPKEKSVGTTTRVCCYVLGIHG